MSISARGPPALPQLTPNTSLLQKDLAAIMKSVQKIDTDWQEKERQLQQERKTLEEEHVEKLKYLHQEQLSKQAEIAMQKEEMSQDMTSQQNRLRWEKEDLAQKKREFEQAIIRSKDIACLQDPITVEVGGEKFHTQVGTLVRQKESIFPNLVKTLQEHSPPTHSSRQPTIFIDRDGKHFKFILNFMRQGEEVMRGTALRNADDYVLNEMLSEVRYYKLTDLERLLQRRRTCYKKGVDVDVLVKSRCFTTQIPPAAVRKVQPFKYMTAKELTLKDVNLSNIVFDRVLFGHQTSFEGCLLVRATFRECTFSAAISFKNADLFEAKFENCQGLELSKRFYLEKANMEGVLFVPSLTGKD